MPARSQLLFYVLPNWRWPLSLLLGVVLQLRWPKFAHYWPHRPTLWLTLVNDLNSHFGLKEKKTACALHSEWFPLYLSCLNSLLAKLTSIVWFLQIFPSTLAPKWPILPSQCGMDHKNPHVSLSTYWRPNTMFENENERQKTKQVPIPLPMAFRNFPDVKTRNEKKFYSWTSEIIPFIRFGKQMDGA